MPPLRILLVDDNADDRLLTIRDLTREFGDLHAHEVPSAAAFERALETASAYDTVITDYELKWSNGLEILRAVRASWPEMPVVMFTGTGNEEVAVQAMKEGLDDYVLKSSPLRLGAAIRVALERADTRRRARELEERLQALLDRLNVGVFRSTLEGRLLAANAAFLRLLGFETLEDARRVRVPDLCADPEDRAGILRVLSERREIRERAVRLRRPDGRVIWVAVTEALQHAEDGETVIDGILEDMTEEHQLQEQLLQAQKMESIGRLAGGIAHDFNNMLTAILSYSDLARQTLTDAHPAHEDLREIEAAAERAASLTGQLLAFSRRQVIEPKAVDLNALIARLDGMLRRLIGDDVELTTLPDPELGTVRADPAQIEQVIMNLAVNSRDAMPDGGKLTIETANVQLEEEYARLHTGVEPGEYVILAVSDTGVGMSEDVKARIFEPFFTTKGEGKGTGLGLAMCYGIVRQSGGHVWVYSEPGEGTTFKLYFPRAAEAADVLAPAHPAPPARALSTASGAKEPTSELSGSETVLLVEDEAAVRALAARVLRKRGYEVLEAADGEAALEIARDEKQRIQLLLTDAVMPKMRGAELAEKMTALRPELRVLFMSGYTDRAVVRHGALEAGAAFVQKPFTPDGLARRVRQILDADGA